MEFSVFLKLLLVNDINFFNALTEIFQQPLTIPLLQNERIFFTSFMQKTKFPVNFFLHKRLIRFVNDLKITVLP